MLPEKIKVLYIEDDLADADFLKSALDLHCYRIDFQVIEEAEDAIHFIDGATEIQNCSLPHLIFLDLNLPKINGKEILRRLKASESHKFIPVIVLTSSHIQADIRDSYGLGASGFIIKPANFDGYKELAKRICEYWLNTSAFPNLDSQDSRT